MSNAIVSLPRPSCGWCSGCGVSLGPAAVTLIRPDGRRAPMCSGCYQYGGYPDRFPFWWDGDRWVAMPGSLSGETLNRLYAECRQRAS